MLLICPACTKRYRVAPGSIPASGRAVKCASCHHSWRAESADASPVASDAVPVTPLPAGSRGPAAARGAPRQFARTGSAPMTGKAAGDVMAGRAFSRPLRAGGSALARLSESYAEEEAAALQDGDVMPAGDTGWEAPVPTFDMDLDSRISEAMASPQISRLIDQERSGNISQGPGGPLGTGNASAAGAVMGRFPYTDHGGGPMPDSRSDASVRPRGPLSAAARLVATLAGAVAGGLEAALSGLDRMRRDDTAAVLTPGDRKVTEWRIAQLRRARRRMTPTKMAGWLALGTMLVGLAYTGIFHRETVAAVWPRAGEMYAALGGIDRAPALTIDRVAHRFAVSTQGPVVELSGFLRHDGDTPVAAPVLRADALDGAGVILSSWAFRVDGPARLSPMSETPFRTRALTPVGTKDVALSVMSEKERALLAPELSPRVMSADGAALGEGFFMQKTTSGWDTGAEALAVAPPRAQD